MKSKDMFKKYIEDSKKGFKGWDFKYLNDSERMKESPLSWNYYNEIIGYLEKSDNLLDMGTGGGEYLSTLPLPKRVVATESYTPNIKIARDRLSPLGIEVYKVDDDEKLPFPENYFDLIINRHESYSPREVMRILKGKGYFISQQVGGLSDRELNKILEAEDCSHIDWNLKKTCDELETLGFYIEKQKEEIVKTRFYDIGAIIYYLNAIPWQVVGFSVEKYEDKLYELHRYIEKYGYIDTSCHRFIIVAQKV